MSKRDVLPSNRSPTTHHSNPNNYSFDIKMGLFNYVPIIPLQPPSQEVYLNGVRGVIINFSQSKNYISYTNIRGFFTIFYNSPFPTPPLEVYKYIKVSRSRWSRGNVLASRSKIRGFKPD